MSRYIDGEQICQILNALKVEEYTKVQEAFNEGIDTAIVEIEYAMTEEKETDKEISIDLFINQECEITLLDGRVLNGKLTADSRYLNIFDKSTNEPCSFYGKDIKAINGTTYKGGSNR